MKDLMDLGLHCPNMPEVTLCCILTPILLPCKRQVFIKNANYIGCKDYQLNSLPTGNFFMLFCRLLFFFKIKSNIRVSNSMDTDQARHFVGPDLGHKCLQKLKTDNTSRQS